MAWDFWAPLGGLWLFGVNTFNCVTKTDDLSAGAGKRRQRSLLKGFPSLDPWVPDPRLLQQAGNSVWRTETHAGSLGLGWSREDTVSAGNSGLSGLDAAEDVPGGWGCPPPGCCRS